MTKIQSLILGMKKLRERITPGPWYIDEVDSGVSAVRTRVTRKDGYPLHVAHANYFGKFRREDEHVDNAKFIAAAPTNQERLERALEIAVEALENIAHTECNAEYKASAQTLEYLRDIRAECEKLKDIEAALGGEL